MPPADWVQRRQQATARWQAELLRRGATFEIGSKSCRQRSRSSCASAAGLWGLYSRVQASTRACSNLTGDELSWAGWDVPPALLERSVLTAGGAAEDSGLGEPRLYQRLLVKLERGDPITVLTLGSSVVGAHAGCTHALPHLGKCPCPRCCGSRCGRWGGGGWGLKLLSYINASWPHPGHRLYNLGEPGGDFMPSLLACPKTYLTFDADLVLLEPDGAPRIETALRRRPRYILWEYSSSMPEPELWPFDLARIVQRDYREIRSVDGWPGPERFGPVDRGESGIPGIFVPYGAPWRVERPGPGLALYERR